MNNRWRMMVVVGILEVSTVWAAEKVKIYSVERKEYVMVEKIEKTDAEWKKQLTPEQFEVAREAGTEAAFTGKYWNNHEKGMYKCVCCGTELFDSDTKFESGTGWPSFYQPINRSNVEEKVDKSHYMTRTE